MTYKTHGIILRHSDWQDYNRIYTLLTRDRGKMSAIARGVRKIKSKQSAKLRPFSVIEVMIANGRKIDTLATAETVRDFPGVMDNLLVLGLASFCTELVDSLTREGEADPKVYLLLEEALALMDCRGQEKAEKLKALSWFFALKLLDVLGYRIDFFKCVTCRDAAADNLSPLNGGVMCVKHSDKNESIKVSEAGLFFLQQTSGMHLADFAELTIEPEFSKEFISYIRPMVFVHLNNELKTEHFLAAI